MAFLLQYTQPHDMEILQLVMYLPSNRQLLSTHLKAFSE